MSIHLAGVPRAPIAGANDPPVFRGEALGEPSASATPAASPTAPAEPGAAPSAVDVLREATAVAAAERRVRAAERAAQVRERERDLAQREERIRQVENRLRAYKGNPALAIQDLSEFGVQFEDLAQVVANGGSATPDQVLAGVRAEVEALRNGVREAEVRREQHEAAARSTAQRAAERDAKAAYVEEITDAASQNAERYPLIKHFGERATDALWEASEALFAKTGKVPGSADVLDAVETELAREIEAATSARSGRRPAPSGDGRSYAQHASIAGPRAGATEAERRRAFLGHLDQLLKGIR